MTNIGRVESLKARAGLRGLLLYRAKERGWSQGSGNAQRGRSRSDALSTDEFVLVNHYVRPQIAHRCSSLASTCTEIVTHSHLGFLIALLCIWSLSSLLVHVYWVGVDVRFFLTNKTIGCSLHFNEFLGRFSWTRKYIYYFLLFTLFHSEKLFSIV